MQQSMPRVFKTKPVMVIQDVVMRWWPTYRIADRLLIFQPALNALHSSNEVPDKKLLTDNDWKTLSDMKVVLEPFAVAQKMLEGDTFIASSMVRVAVASCHSSLKRMHELDETAEALKPLRLTN